jgi:predicted acylesterase/phospholipase RssA
MKDKMPAYIAFQGGGALGMAHLGAWQVVAQKYNITGTAGTSAGSIVAAFCAAQYHPKDTINVFHQLQWSEYVKRKNILKLMWKRDAYSDGNKFHRWLQESLRQNVSGEPVDVSFYDLYQATNIYLAIVACDLNSEQKIIFDSDSHSEQTTKVSFAVRASISIPGFFDPMIRTDKLQKLVDGGLLLNFPVELLYEKSKEKNCPLIGVRFKEEKKKLKNVMSTKISVTAGQAIEVLLKRANVLPDYISQYRNYIDIPIDVSDFNFLNFELTDTEKYELVKRGVDAAQKALAEYQKAQNEKIHITRQEEVANIEESSPPKQPKIPEESEAEGFFYVERPPLEFNCDQIISQPGSLLRIKAPSAMGKTSLMAKVVPQLEQRGYRAVYLNLFYATEKDLITNLDKFLKWLCTSVSKALGLPNKLADYWDEEWSTSMVDCKTYFEKYLLANTDSPLLLWLDEVDRIFPYEQVAPSFLGMLRNWHEEGKSKNIWKRLRLVVSHSTEVYVNLSINESPFNVGQRIILPGFTSEQIQKLAQQYGLSWNLDQIEPLRTLVGGHPYLVQQAIFSFKNNQSVALESILQAAATEEGIYANHLRRYWNIIQQYPELVEAFKKVVIATGNVRLETMQAYQLNSMGLVHLVGNEVRITCELYRQYFRVRFGVS